MNIFHTADWHLGKLVQGMYMTEDQQFILEQFMQHVEREKPDVVIVAGDLYDRALPPVEAVKLLDEVFEKIVLELNVPVLAIAGNHDSPARIHYGSKLLKKAGLHVVGQLESAFTPVVTEDAFGVVHTYLLPYVDPAQVKHFFKDDAVTSQQTAMARMMAHYDTVLQRDVRNVLVAHAFVTKHGEEAQNTSDSERTLSVGGSDCVSAELFQAFDYVALGHLHEAHYVLRESIQYAGSPLKYSVSEQHHKKGYLHVELRDKGDVRVEKVLLAPRRDMRTVETTLNELLHMPRSDDYVFVKLLDEQAVQSPMEQVRTVFPNALHVERVMPAMQTEQLERSTRAKRSTTELFSAFIEEMTGQPVRPEAAQLFNELLQQTMLQEREVEA
ncbi:exonuclease SbcCD subunit D [Caryophanon latum]|uniref:Nuclease SbcCD subunit D n=1 Tax=Caryophanon latum TaxID=33977 RepID=A0A1C0YW73_9BACL|nr:exonuclease SbcCD subunit D [Caryophanon latum]OCS91375.1 exonuclease sbcCD subunit D [Caryophanon latum]